MERKLVQQGNATLMVSIPSKWAKAQKLNKGSVINLEVQQNKLVLSPTKKEEKQEIEIKITSEIESAVRTLVTNAYRAGYDRVIVKYENEKSFEILQHIIKTRLIGFDIIGKEKKKCVIENITEPSHEQFDNIFEKLFLSIKRMIEITAERCKNKQNRFMKEIELIQQRIQSYDNFCRRVIAKGKYPESKKQFYWTFMALMIHGERELYHLNKLVKKETKVSEKVQEFFPEILHMVELLEKAYREKRTDVIEHIHAHEKRVIYKKGYDLLKKVKDKNVLILYHVLASGRQFYQANSPLTGIILN